MKPIYINLYGRGFSGVNFISGRNGHGNVNVGLLSNPRGNATRINGYVPLGTTEIVLYSQATDSGDFVLKDFELEAIAQEITQGSGRQVKVKAVKQLV